MRALMVLSLFVSLPSIAVAQSTAKVGEKAPSFALTAVDGKTHEPASAKGKLVVLEWFNPDCPFVKRAYNEGPMKALQKAHLAAGGLWFTINSNAAGKQGHGQARNAEAVKAWGLAHPVLLDEKGVVGRAYGATRTPELVVIDAGGKVVYHGALDSTGGGGYGGKEPAVGHLAEALTAARAGKPVAVGQTKPWGCSVKYGAPQ